MAAIFIFVSVTAGQEGFEGVTGTWDLMQHDLKCCGSGNYTEWRKMGHGVPDSCCKVGVLDSCKVGVPDFCCKVGIGCSRLLLQGRNTVFQTLAAR